MIKIELEDQRLAEAIQNIESERNTLEQEVNSLQNELKQIDATEHQYVTF